MYLLYESLRMFRFLSMCNTIVFNLTSETMTQESADIQFSKAEVASKAFENEILCARVSYREFMT